MPNEQRWYPVDKGNTIGQRGSEQGVILKDEEHIDGARITLERDGYTPFAITCGIYGCMVHTCFFSTEEEATRAFAEIKGELETLIALVPEKNDPDIERKWPPFYEAVRRFVDKH